MSETITEYANGRTIMRVDGIELTVGGKPHWDGYSPDVRLTDLEYRYYATFPRGDMLPGSSPTQDQKLAAMRDVLREYLTYRGTRTSWTVEDAWMLRWRKTQAALSNSNPS